MEKYPIMVSLFNRLTQIMIMVAVCGLLLGCSGASASTLNPTIKIGVVIPLNTDEVFLDVVRKHYDQIVAELNAEGGLAVKGQLIPVELIYADSALDVEVGVQAVQQLIDEENIIALVGPHYGKVAVAALDLADAAGIPTMIPIYSGGGLATTEKPYAFQLVSASPHLMTLAARFIYINLGIDKVAVLANSPEKGTFSNVFEELGGQIQIEVFQASDTDFRPQLTQIRDSGAGLILVGGDATASVQILTEQTHELGITAPFLNATSFFFLPPEMLWKIQGVFVILDFVPDLATEEALEEYAHFEEAHDIALSTLDKIFFSYTGDALGLLLAAIQRAGSLEPTEIRNALATTRYYDGLTGLISYDERGIPLRHLIVMQVYRDQFIFYDLVRDEAPSAQSGIAQAQAAEVEPTSTSVMTNEENSTSADNAASNKPIKIGFIGPLTGDGAFIGNEMLGFAKVVTEMYSEQTGLTFEIVEGDTRIDADAGRIVAERFAADEQILGVIGPAVSQVCEATQPIFDKATLVHLTPSCTKTDLTETDSSTFFRPIPTDADQGKTIAAYMVNQLEIQSAFLVDDQSSYAVGLNDEIAFLLEKVGITDIVRVSVTQQETDFSSIVTSANAQGIDVVFFGGQLSKQAGTLALQLQAKGYDGLYFLSSAGFDPEWIGLAGDAAEGAYVVFYTPDPRAVPNANEMTTRYREQFTDEFGAFGGAAGFTTQILLEAVIACAETDTLTRTCVHKAVAASNLESTVLDIPVKFGPNNQAEGSHYFVFQVQNGAFVLQVTDWAFILPD
ncbi:MAG: ABC transporter substrate-binding protein [Chloroflexota bacterium]